MLGRARGAYVAMALAARAHAKARNAVAVPWNRGADGQPLVVRPDFRGAGAGVGEGVKRGHAQGGAFLLHNRMGLWEFALCSSEL